MTKCTTKSDAIDPPMTLRQLANHDAHIHAHVFCEICGIKPATLRQARYRARVACQPDPLGARQTSPCRVLISVRSAIGWLQKTGRHMAVLRLAEWIDQQERQAYRDMYVPSGTRHATHSVEQGW